MDPSTSSAAASDGRQKRVLPSRARRGGPGVGSCDTDLMILEHQRRRFETESIISPATPFLLTTDSNLFSNASEASVTTVASDRYFDRPDVLKAYREQLTIQTPSYRNVKDNLVVARFRPRGPEDAQIDTSDAAYERRHRKYESFEKRQRLREKEKLKHEQYKLKERIDQLRIMDASAFLALPASNFSPALGISEEVLDNGTSSLPGAHINGSASNTEGERRRKEMLDIALSLEERFKTLLPPDRVRRPQLPPAMRENTAMTPASVPSPPPFTSVPLRRDISDASASEKEEQLIFIDQSYNRRQDKFRIKLKLAGKASTSQSPAPTTASRSSKRSAGASIPPAIGPIPATRRRSRVERSPSPARPRSSSKPIESSSRLPLPEPIQSPHIEVEEPDGRQEFAPESEEEFIPPVPAEPRASTSLDRKFEMDLTDAMERSQICDVSRPQPPTPPQKRSPLPDTRPSPEIDPVLLELDRLRRYPPEGQSIQTSPIMIDEEPRVQTQQSPVQQSMQSCPPSVPVEMESAPSRLESEVITHGGEGSRLLELANVVHSITTTSPPAKRQKTWHSHSPSITRVPSSPIPISPSAEPPSDVHPSVAVEEPVLSSGEFMDATNSPQTASVPPPVTPPPTLSEPVLLPSELPSEPALLPSESASALLSGQIMPEVMSIYTARRRRMHVNRSSKEIEYRSPDTGQLMRTQSSLLIAGIRGSIRQTARHQTAFGVKVPEEISDPYDFWLPDEYLPEEELMKYRHYEYHPVPSESGTPI
ncbi:hypothetical protein Agabi119p4_321 [Agaricus bisporus var. burnettii]|uniref:PEHE domain-containing protein n=2 Tax=Agaricus bisporus var. burnettii TaxID=192524 RepID=A0A8H7FAL4_AGABI|nr:hypothetical protein Agabi119p4_321 [Agaricus bisporus var. burnettii]